MIIESADKVMVRGRAVGTATAEAVLTAYNGLIRAKAKGTSSAEGTLKHIKPLSGLAEGASSGWAFLRLDGGPNHFLSGIATGTSAATATITRRIKPFARSNGASSAEGTLTYFAPEMAELLLIVDVFPEHYGSSQRVRGRLLVDGEPVLLETYQYTKRTNDLTAQLSATIADVNDRVKITPTSYISFDIGVWDNTDWVWVPLLDLGEVNSTNYVFSRERDSFSFVGIPAQQAKLAQTPPEDLVIYDPLVETLSTDDFEPIPDTGGNLHYTQLVPSAGLTLYRLMDLIFVNRCGFDSVETNIPNWRIPRADFRAGVSYMATMGAIKGFHKPRFSVIGNVLWIWDSTAGVPAGFPSPRPFTLSDSAARGISATIEHLDAVRLTYSTDRANYNFIGFRTETETTEDDSNPNVRITSTVTRTIKQYFRSENPFTPVDEDIVSVEEQQFIQRSGLGTTLVYEATENYTYDAFGNPKKRIRVENRRLPDIRIEEWPEVMLETKRVTETWTYKPNPFRPGTKYQSLHSVIEEALLTVDHDRLRLGQPYREGYTETFQSANIEPTMTLDFAPIRSFIEKVKPLRDGRCRIDRTETDLLNNVVVNADSQMSVGEISMSGLVKESKEIYVFDDDLGIRTTDKILYYDGGNAPLNVLIPLCRRILKQKRAGESTFSDTLAVFDLSVEEGSMLNVRGRENEDLGDYLVTARTITGNRNLHSIQIEAEKIG